MNGLTEILRDDKVIPPSNVKMTEPEGLKVGRLICEWDIYEITKAQAEFLKESGEYEGKTDDEIFQVACEDSDNVDQNWRCLCNILTELMKRNSNGGWKVVVSNFGWRKQNGHKFFQATDGKKLLREVLPDCECAFKVYRYGRGLAINNAHHDSPTWNEWYYITPCNKRI